MPLTPGTRLGRYEVLSPLGAGGMGEVYLARDTTELEREVAVKVLPAEMATDPERMSRFVQEARSASSLNHPNIITVHEIGQEDGTRYLVTEYVEGETLRRRMTRESLTLREALDIAVQIASALVAAHKAGVVHRDIKPENVMVRGDGIVKVLDFGLAKPTSRPTGQTPTDSEAATRALVNTSPGLVMGTVSYMSPEQARGLPVDKRTDIWSLGVVLYEMLEGRLPFSGDTPSDVIAHVLTKEPPALTLTTEKASDRLDEIVQKALAKDRDERYQHVKDLLIDLRRLKQRLDVDAEIERTHSPDEGAATTGPGRGTAKTINTSAAHTADLGDAHPTSSAEYVVTEIKRHRRGALMILAAIALAAAAVGYFAYSRYFSGGGGGIRSVAVLPFANEGGDPEAEYLSDGISESLINSLSRLPGVKVIARSSSFKYKGKEADPQEVARALGVEGVLTGRVAQRGDQLLVSAELVDARDRTQVWGDRYSRKASDLLAVQAEISREIADRLRLQLTSGDAQRLARGETDNPQAYELVLKGRFHRFKGGTENRKKAVEYFLQAVAADPDYALAHAELSVGYGDLVNDSTLEPKEGVPKAEAAARRALESDDGLAEAHLALAILKMNAWDWAAAEWEFRRAVESNPNLATALNKYSEYHSLVGRHDEAVAEVRRAGELDPLSLPIHRGVGDRLLNARRYDEAIQVLRKALELDQNDIGTHVSLGYTYAAKGMYREAAAEYEEAARLGGDSPSTQIYLGAAYAQAGARERARAILRQLETSKEYVSPGELAVLYVALGERERAFASLERAYAEHDLQLKYLGVDPPFDPLRSDPRFRDLLRRVGLPE